ERGACRDAERERRRERIAQQRLHDDPRRGQGRPDDRAGEYARHPGDEENLRVDVVGKRNRAVEGAREADVGAADQRRQHARPERQRAIPEHDGPEARTDAAFVGPPPERQGHHADRPMGTTVRWPARGWNCTSASTSYNWRTMAPVSTSLVAPCARTRPPRITTSRSHNDAARFRSCVASTIVTCRSRLRRARRPAISS